MGAMHGAFQSTPIRHLRFKSVVTSILDALDRYFESVQNRISDGEAEIVVDSQGAT